MNLVKFYNPHYNVTRNLVDDLFGNFFNNDYHENYVKHCSENPATNVLETEKDFKLEILLPGFAKEDVSLNCKNRVLTIKAETKKENAGKTEGYKYEHREFETFAFEKQYRLPKEVDVDKISAGFENGVLTLLLPKKEEAPEKAPLKIEIA